MMKDEKPYMDDRKYINQRTLEFVSTLISVVTLFLFNWVLTSARNNSPFFVPDDVIACMLWKLES